MEGRPFPGKWDEGLIVGGFPSRARSLWSAAIGQVMVSEKRESGGRTNIVFVNPADEPATVTVSVHRGGSVAVFAVRTRGPLEPGGFRQLPLDAVEFPGLRGTTAENLWIELSSDRPVLSYATVINNMSGDPYAVTASPDSLSSDCFIGKFEVTQAQWQAVMGSDPTWFPSRVGDCAVDRVSWDDIAGPGGFLERLRGLPGEPRFRRPTEAEREGATRGGTQTRFFFGGELDSRDTCGLPSDREYMRTCGGGSPHPVGMKKPNPFGLYDVHGNVNEWAERDRE
ncbi:MAG: formylglycine-generating enzyme family protein, partial [Thermoanaerobaculia bacterium]|nr:formylglycine-generating enzyme family protein [Thermoanaerobaculia bacterium]